MFFRGHFAAQEEARRRFGRFGHLFRRELSTPGTLLKFEAALNAVVLVFCVSVCFRYYQ